MYELYQLPKLDFSIENILIREDRWVETEVVDYMEKGRSKNLIHIITDGARYYRIGKECFHLNAGNLLFIPDGTPYYTTNHHTCSGIGICFDLYTPAGNLTIRPAVYHCWQDHWGEYLSLIREMTNSFSEARHGNLHKKALLWLLLDKMISDMENLSELGRMMLPALRHLQLHYRENEPVSVYASACNLSESHFRRKFLEYTGMTPLEYRDSLRFEEARRLYVSGIPMTQIAERVGFCDASYLRRLYKKRTGSHFRDSRSPEII